MAHTDRAIRNLSRDEAVTLLKKRLTVIGGLLGFLMGLLWTLVAVLLVPGFPEPFSAPFLVISFTSLLLLSAGGVWSGRRFWRKSLPEEG